MKRTLALEQCENVQRHCNKCHLKRVFQQIEQSQEPDDGHS
jgi:hypothetical protein